MRQGHVRADAICGDQPAVRLANQIRQVRNRDGPARADKDTDITIPAVIPVTGIRISLTSETEDVHGTHVDADAAFVAAALIYRDPGIIGFVI